MNEYTKLERVLSCLTIDELELLKERLLGYHMVKESDYIDLTQVINLSMFFENNNKESPYYIFETSEIKDCINAGIEEVGAIKMIKIVDELIEEKEEKGEKENMEKQGNGDVEWEARVETMKVLNDLNIHELEHIERNSSAFIKEQSKMKYPLEYIFCDFESDFRKDYEIDEIENYIQLAIINFGAFRIHDVVVGILQEKKNEYVNTVRRFNKLQDKIIEWGRSKNINDPKSQFLKVIEEFGEIHLAKNKEEFMDAIGDTLVTLIILNDVVQRESKDKEERFYFLGVGDIDKLFFYEYAKQKGQLKGSEDLFNRINADIIKELSRIAECISKTTDDNKIYYYEEIRLHILEVIRYVTYISKSTNTDFIECLQLAYDTIANRKGKTIDGVFVKEEDLGKEEE